MEKKNQKKSTLPTYTAPKEILNSIQLEENNEAIKELDKKIPESTKNKSRKREMSPPRIGPQSKRTYKEIMLEQKKNEELARKKNQQNNNSDEIKGNNNININYNSSALNLNNNSNAENYSTITKETKLTNNDYLSHKRKKSDGYNPEKEEFSKPAQVENNMKNKRLGVEIDSQLNNNYDSDDEEDDYDKPTPKISSPRSEKEENNEEENISNEKNEKEEIKEKSENVEKNEKYEKDENDENNKNDENNENEKINENDKINENEENKINENNEIDEINEADKINENNEINENDENNENNENKEDEDSEITQKIESPKNTNHENEYIKTSQDDIKYNIDYIERNKPLTDEEINAILPGENSGYQVITPPENYQKYISNIISQKRLKYASDPSLALPEPEPQISTENFNDTLVTGLKPEDKEFFQVLFTTDNNVDESQLSTEEIKKRQFLSLLLKVKNGIPPIKKSSFRQILERTPTIFPPQTIFSNIIPLLMSPSLDDEEKHTMVKLLNRILIKLNNLVRPYTHKILVAVSSMLMDEILYVRIEGREIISNLAKSVGMPTMISVLRPDVESMDENVRTVTAKILAIVASSLGLNEFLPFLKAICQTKKNWTIRETGIKTVQQIAILTGNGILPYLQMLIDIIKNGFQNEHQKVKIFTALAISSLAEACYPYGIDYFMKINKFLIDGIKKYKGKLLASFFKAFGNIIVLMDDDIATRNAKIILPILKKEFISPDENIRRTLLVVLKQCLLITGIDYTYVKEEISNDFFSSFWNRRMALDRKNYHEVINVTVEISKKISCAEVLNIIVYYLKDENEIFRKMTLECIEKIIKILGVIDIDKRIEQLLIDGLMLCFEEQNTDESNTNNSNNILLSCFGQVIESLGTRIKPYLPNICTTIQWRFNNKNPKVREQSANLISKLSDSLKLNGEEALMTRLGMILDENLGEEYPEVLGSILNALYSLAKCIGLSKMTPPIKELLPKLTPILANRNEKVEENVVKLIGLIAEKGASYGSAKEWMRICFDLLELFKAHRKIIRRYAVNTFGHIAKAIGPQDVLMALLNNLRLQERQDRICTTVAIAVVAESCGPFTVIPALMNEYRVSELNVQNGVLKALSFMFEYVGEMARDYIYAIISLLKNALTERELVHRQQACSIVKHLGINVAGLNCEDALIHILNYLWPNIFEDAPHFQMAFLEAIEGLRIGLGVNVIMKYILQGLFHPARRIREAYWRVYNLLYVGAQDDLCMCLPTLPDEKNGILWKRVEKKEELMCDGDDDLYEVKPFNKYETVELNLFI